MRIKKLLNKFITVMLVVIMIINVQNTVLVCAAEANEDEAISISLAESIAVEHIKNIMSTDISTKWNIGVRICERRAIFDVSDNIIEYYFGLEDKNGDARGYVITGATTSEYPIIEYSDDGDSFINRAISETAAAMQGSRNISSEEECTKVYYEGDMSYLVKHILKNNDNSIFDISTCDYEEISEQTFESRMVQKAKENYKEVWNSYQTMSLKQTRGSNPPDNNSDFITNPNNYESGYADADYYTITKGYVYYNIMTDFSSGGVCTPTAATNLCKYWYLRDTTKYINLYKNGSWKDTFDELYDNMHTDPKEGTPEVNVASAYEQYFEKRGLLCDAHLFYGTNNGRDIVNELRQDRPCHLMLFNHKKYGDHSVLAVGYSRFMYNTGMSTSYSIYIRIADGWTNYPSRFVWGACYGTWDYVVVAPDGTL